VLFRHVGQVLPVLRLKSRAIYNSAAAALRAAAPKRPGCCPSFGCSLAARLLLLVLLPLAAGGWLLLWRPATAPGGWLLSLAARLLPIVRLLRGARLLPSFCCPWRLVAVLVLLPLAAGCCPWRPGCCHRSAASGGWLLPLAARLLPLVRLLPGGPAAAPRSAAPGGWLLPSFCCSWRLAAPPGAWLLPSFCSPWRLASALVLPPLTAGCCLRSAAPGGWLLHSFCP